MPAINPESIPGSVAVPTWTLIAAIVVVFLAREWERKAWFEKLASATTALDKLTDSVTKMMEQRSKP